MNKELTKSEKKIARIIIDKGIQHEYEKSILLLDEIIGKWKDKRIDNRDAYQELYRTLRERNKHIALRYDGLSGSRYLETVIFQLVDGVISKKDLNDFSPELRESIIGASKLRL